MDDWLTYLCLAVSPHARLVHVFSCLFCVFKLLLNVCTCEVAQEDVEEEAENESVEDFVSGDEELDGEGERAGAVVEANEDEDEVEDEEDPMEESSNGPQPEGSSSIPSGLTVIVPGRTDQASSKLSSMPASRLPEVPVMDEGEDEEEEDVPAATVVKGCGYVTVMNGTGALEFNSEDVAALLTLALRRLYPFMALAARLAAAAAEKDRDADGDADDQDEEDERAAEDDRVWTTVQQFVRESRASAAAAEAEAEVASASTCSSVSASVSGANGVCSAGLFSGPLPPPGEAAANVSECGGSVTSVAAVRTSCNPALTVEVVAANGAGEAETGESATELTVSEASDLLDYVAAARFVAHLLAEPVVAMRVSAGKWKHTEQLAKQVQSFADEKEDGVRMGAAVDRRDRVYPSSSLDNLCLGALADVEGLAETMAQQARFAPMLETTLKGELRRAMKRGQGRQRRLKNRLQAPQGAPPGVMSFPLVGPGCFDGLYMYGGRVM